MEICLPECDGAHYHRRVPKIRRHLPLPSSRWMKW